MPLPNQESSGLSATSKLVYGRPALADKHLGLLINFHVALIKDGITRVVNGLEDAHAKFPSRKDG